MQKNFSRHCLSTRWRFHFNHEPVTVALCALDKKGAAQVGRLTSIALGGSVNRPTSTRRSRAMGAHNRLLRSGYPEPEA
jgi:hypothetical protein